MKTYWNVLVVDDDREQAETTAELISGRKALKAGPDVKCMVVCSFGDAIAAVERSKFDLMILDLNDEANDRDADGTNYGGQRILAELRKFHFTPVVFYTGYAGKIGDLASPFVKIVDKGAPASELRGAINSIFETKLPQLLQHIQEQQRQYLWEHLESAGIDKTDNWQSEDFAFLLARRLSHSLEGKAIRSFFDPERQDAEEVAHPVELYVWPPLGNRTGFGDILKNGYDEYFVVLNPACDFAQQKAEQVLLAQCTGLDKTEEYSEVVKAKESGQQVSATKRKELLCLLRDNRQGKGVQAERYKFLPRTIFLPNLVIDYQSLTQVPLKVIKEEFVRVATLDGPFAEAVQSRFVRYYGRIGTPDLEFERLVNNLLEAV